MSIKKVGIASASVLLGLGFAGLTANHVNAAAMHGTVHINPVAGHPTWKILLWDGSGHGTKTYLSPNTNWKVFESRMINGIKYYRLGNDRQWVQAQYADASNAVEESQPVHVQAVYTVGNQAVGLVDSNGHATGRLLPAGSRWKAFAKKTINGNLYYRLGSQQQWVLASAGTLTGTVNDEPTAASGFNVPTTRITINQPVNGTLNAASKQAIIAALQAANPRIRVSETATWPVAAGDVHFDNQGGVVVYANNGLQTIRLADFVSQAAPDQADLKLPAAKVEIAQPVDGSLNATSKNAIINALQNANPDVRVVETSTWPQAAGEVYFNNQGGIYIKLRDSFKTINLADFVAQKADASDLTMPTNSISIPEAVNGRLSETSKQTILAALQAANPEVRIVETATVPQAAGEIWFGNNGSITYLVNGNTLKSASLSTFVEEE